MPTAFPLLLLVACRGCDEGTGVESPGPSAIVVVLDGVRSDEFTSTTTSDLTGQSGEAYADLTWQELAPDAAIVRDGLNEGVTITGPAHANLLTGTWLPYANIPVDNDREGANYRPDLPTIFEEARDQLGLDQDAVAVFGNTEFIKPLGFSTFPGFGEDLGAVGEMTTDPNKPGAPINDDAPIFDSFKSRIEDGPPRLMLANCHDVDRAGHYGEGNAYIDDVEKLDGLVAGFWRWLKDEQPAYTEDLLLVIVADHGRHDHELDNGWHNHGDACLGCRHVPLFLLGGGAEAGTVVEGEYSITDVAPTIAAHMGFELPWAEGLPLFPLMPGTSATARSGVRDLAVDGDLVATATFADDYAARSTVEVDGAVVSTPGALHAEAPVVLRGADADYVCFRELVLVDAAASWPWTGRCLRREGDGAWQDIGFAVDEVSPFWQPTLRENDAGTLEASWAHNPDFLGELGAEKDVGVYSAHWTSAQGWAEDGFQSTFVPTDVARDDTWIAFGTDDGETESRYTRHVEVGTMNGGFSADPFLDLTGNTERVERPAIRVDGDTITVAALWYPGDEWQPMWSQSTDGGDTWSSPADMGTTDPAVPVISPVFDGDWLVWATMGDTASICRYDVGTAATACVALDSPRVRGFVVHDGAGTALIDVGVGEWAEADFAF